MINPYYNTNDTSVPKYPYTNNDTTVSGYNVPTHNSTTN